MTGQANAPIVVGLGEILWDIFPTEAHFGGAPTNFACHAAALGGRVWVVSGVGQDELGKKAIEVLRERNVGIEFVQTSAHPTGTVQVSIDKYGQAKYYFAAEVAWDHLVWNDSLAALAGQCQAVCFGTLAQRSPISCMTIERFLRSTHPDCIRIFDVNLRQNFYDRDMIDESLCAASVLKLNEDELPILARLLDGPTVEPMATMRWLSDRYIVPVVALTRGERGSIIYANGRFDEQVPPSVQVVDTVGAGDAFTAAIAIGLLTKQPIPVLHRKASEIAAFVCTQPGATPSLSPLFRPVSFERKK